MSGALHVAAIAAAAAGAILTLVCSVGLVAMRDPYQRLHFAAPPATLGAFLVAVGVWLDGGGLAAGLKSILILVLLTAQAAVLTHATARAIFVHQNGRWPPDPRLPISRGCTGLGCP